jgi:serine phosphatase RsbU (regulator of sigma subunit)
MADALPSGSAALDVIHPSGERTRILIDPVPFRIGRGPENQLILRDNRASRAHARIFKDAGSFAIEDLDSLHGTWVNGVRIEKPISLRSGDAIHFGFEDSYRLLFSDLDRRINRILDQISSVSSQPSGPAGSFARLRALVEVARTLQTALGGDEVLSAVIDAALALTGADRGFLLLRSGDELEIKLGRDSHGSALHGSDLQVPTTLIRRALEERRDLLSMTLEPEDLRSAGASEGEAEFRNIICVPLVHFRGTNAEETMSLASQTNTVGLLYLDSRQKQRPLSELNRELLHSLALEASTALENAKLLEEERHRGLLEQELGLARQIQRSLLPHEFPASGWFCAAGSSLSSAQVAGDYFDIHRIDSQQWAAVIADVSGKGLSSALLASLLQGAFLLGSELQVPLDALMSKINHFLIERAQREKYATLFYATVHRSGLLAWVNAGHCSPFLLRQKGEVERLESTGTPLGLIPEPEFEVKHLQLAPGDKIIAYSDGLTEAENSKGESFEEGLKQLLQQLPAFSAQEIHNRLIEGVLQFSEGNALRDDVTLLVLEYRTTSDLTF